MSYIKGMNIAVAVSVKQRILMLHGCVFRGQECLDNHEIDFSKPCYCGRPLETRNITANADASSLKTEAEIRKLLTQAYRALEISPQGSRQAERFQIEIEILKQVLGE